MLHSLLLTLLTPPLLLFFGAFAHAESTTVWSLKGTDLSGWDIRGFTAITPTPEGLRIQSQDEGHLRRSLGTLPHGIDVVSLSIASTKNGEGLLFWASDGEEVYQLPFTFTAALQRKDIDLVPSNYEEWNPEASFLGIAFPPGTDILLGDIRLRGWSTSEKLMEGLRSFWTFDSFRPYSINFLWGPLLTFNPIGRRDLFENLPPFAWSAHRIFYSLLLLAGIAVILLGRTRGWYERVTTYATALLTLLFVFLWIFFDMRMGTELLVYAHRDWKGYVRAVPGHRVLRTHSTFYDAAQESMTSISSHPSFAVLFSPESPFYGVIRYLAYPSLPLTGDAANGATLWMVYEDPYADVDEQGRLFHHTGTVAIDTSGKIVQSEHRILTMPGKVLKRWNNTSFLFEVSK